MNLDDDDPPRCYFCRVPADMGHMTYCPEWEDWSIEQARLEEEEDDR